MHLGKYALFEFKWNSSTESDVNGTLRTKQNELESILIWKKYVDYI